MHVRQVFYSDLIKVLKISYKKLLQDNIFLHVKMYQHYNVENPAIIVDSI